MNEGGGVSMVLCGSISNQPTSLPNLPTSCRIKRKNSGDFSSHAEWTKRRKEVPSEKLPAPSTAISIPDTNLLLPEFLHSDSNEPPPPPPPPGPTPAFAYETGRRIDLLLEQKEQNSRISSTVPRSASGVVRRPSRLSQSLSDSASHDELAVTCGNKVATDSTAMKEIPPISAIPSAAEEDMRRPSSSCDAMDSRPPSSTASASDTIGSHGDTSLDQGSCNKQRVIIVERAPSQDHIRTDHGLRKRTEQSNLGQRHTDGGRQRRRSRSSRSSARGPHRKEDRDRHHRSRSRSRSYEESRYTRRRGRSHSRERSQRSSNASPNRRQMSGSRSPSLSSKSGHSHSHPSTRRDRRMSANLLTPCSRSDRSYSRDRQRANSPAQHSTSHSHRAEFVQMPASKIVIQERTVDRDVKEGWTPIAKADPIKPRKHSLNGNVDKRGNDSFGSPNTTTPKKNKRKRNKNRSLARERQENSHSSKVHPASSSCASDAANDLEQQVDHASLTEEFALQPNEKLEEQCDGGRMKVEVDDQSLAVEGQIPFSVTQHEEIKTEDEEGREIMEPILDVAPQLQEPEGDEKDVEQIEVNISNQESDNISHTEVHADTSELPATLDEHTDSAQTPANLEEPTETMSGSVKNILEAEISKSNSPPTIIHESPPSNAENWRCDVGPVYTPNDLSGMIVVEAGSGTILAAEEMEDLFVKDEISTETTPARALLADLISSQIRLHVRNGRGAVARITGTVCAYLPSSKICYIADAVEITLSVTTIPPPPSPTSIISQEGGVGAESTTYLLSHSTPIRRISQVDLFVEDVSLDDFDPFALIDEFYTIPSTPICPPSTPPPPAESDMTNRQSSEPIKDSDTTRQAPLTPPAEKMTDTFAQLPTASCVETYQIHTRTFPCLAIPAHCITRISPLPLH